VHTTHPTDNYPLPRAGEAVTALLTARYGVDTEDVGEAAYEKDCDAEDLDYALTQAHDSYRHAAAAMAYAATGEWPAG